MSLLRAHSRGVLAIAALVTASCASVAGLSGSGASDAAADRSTTIDSGSASHTDARDGSGEGSDSSGVVSTVTDSSQRWVANQFASGWSFDDNSVGLAQTGITANTADTVTFQNSGASLAVGDYYEIQGPGVGVGEPVLLPDAAYGPAAMTSGAWNTYSVPLTAFDTATPDVSQAFVVQFGIQDHTGNASNTLYFCNMGYN